MIFYIKAWGDSYCDWDSSVIPVVQTMFNYLPADFFTQT